MDWRVEAKPGVGGDETGDRAERIASLVRSLEAPNEGDSFRTLIEQVIEDTLVGGFGAAELELTGDPRRPVQLYPVDGASVQVNAKWTGAADEPRYAQVTGKVGADSTMPLLDSELMYVRLNPRSHTVFGLGKLEVAFETISQFLSANRYASRLASNSVMQFAIWVNERTPEQQERLIGWWQDEVEGSGRVPFLSSEQKPEVLRFNGGTEAELHIGWQQFLVGMIANAFDLPAMMLGAEQGVNRATAQELANEAFQNAVVPVARLIAEHLTRDVIAKRLGWEDLRFCWNDLDGKDPLTELQVQMELLKNGVLDVDEVRAMRGLSAMGNSAS
jgi:HK97 family phage portal protein